MNSEDKKKAETKRQEILTRLRIAEAALRNVLQESGYGDAVREHLERAAAHVSEAYISVNETKQIRSVPQLVDDLNRIQKVVDDAKRGHSQRI